MVDFDVHHGNGTQDLFYDDPSVLFVDLHQHDVWPGTGQIPETGAGSGQGYTINVPLPGAPLLIFFPTEASYWTCMTRGQLCQGENTVPRTAQGAPAKAGLLSKC